ncbi:MAG: hypothetical protein OEW05_00325 [Candidatus Aminicenantes bacterium]|nr:hypothetical protein [Candidatus Aminicenantes bacterium]
MSAKARSAKKRRGLVQEFAPLVMQPTADSRRTRSAREKTLFARVTSFLLAKDRVDEAVRLYRTSVVPAARSQKGFRGAFLLVDRASGKGQSITLWTSENDAAANEAGRYYQEQLAKFLTFYTAPPIREGFELALEVRQG